MNLSRVAVALIWHGFALAGLIEPAKNLITGVGRRTENETTGRDDGRPLATGHPREKDRRHPLVSVVQLQREIRKISTRVIGRCASMDELDQAWATLTRLQDALALATERAKGLADD